MRLRVEPGVSTAPTDNGGLIVLCEGTGKLHRCNPTAAVIWAALVEHEGDTDAAVVAVAAHYDVATDLVRADLTALVDKLSQAELVRVEP